MKTRDQQLPTIEEEKEITLNKLREEAKKSEQLAKSFYKSYQELFNFMYSRLNSKDQMEVDKQVKELMATV